MKYGEENRKMFEEDKLCQLSNMWNKDEEIFVYSMKLLKNKLTSLEYSQWMFHYYYVNDKFEQAVDYLVSIKQQTEAREFTDFMSSDDLDDGLDLCCCLLKSKLYGIGTIVEYNSWCQQCGCCGFGGIILLGGVGICQICR